MDLQLTGKRAIVTGGSRGIGRAIARELAAEGVNLVLAARGEADLKAAAQEINAFAVPTDTTDPASVIRLVEQATELLGGVDILINAAAESAGGGGPTLTAAPTALLAEWDTKALGYLRCAQAVAPTMIDQGWGRIINIGGLAARQTGAVSASMRNAAVTALTKNLADELGPHGVNVTAVQPGTTRTERVAARPAKSPGNAIGRIIEPEEVAYVVAFLASPRSTAITGDVITCGGGRLGSIHY